MPFAAPFPRHTSLGMACALQACSSTWQVLTCLTSRAFPPRKCPCPRRHACLALAALCALPSTRPRPLPSQVLDGAVAKAGSLETRVLPCKRVPRRGLSLGKSLTCPDKSRCPRPQRGYAEGSLACTPLVGSRCKGSAPLASCSASRTPRSRWGGGGFSIGGGTNRSDEGLNLSGSWQQGHSAAYNTPSRI
jgi:hypothetical protein